MNPELSGAAPHINPSASNTPRPDAVTPKSSPQIKVISKAGGGSKTESVTGKLHGTNFARRVVASGVCYEHTSCQIRVGNWTSDEVRGSGIIHIIPAALGRGLVGHYYGKLSEDGIREKVFKIEDKLLSALEKENVPRTLVEDALALERIELQVTPNMVTELKVNSQPNGFVRFISACIRLLGSTGSNGK